MQHVPSVSSQYSVTNASFTAVEPLLEPELPELLAVLEEPPPAQATRRRVAATAPCFIFTKIARAGSPCVREVVASAAQRREGVSSSGSRNWNFL